jgi:hypothetical protein
MNNIIKLLIITIEFDSFKIYGKLKIDLIFEYSSVVLSYDFKNIFLYAVYVS